MNENRITKSIVFAFPTSTNAEALGMSETGCWHISLTSSNIEGSGQACRRLPHDAEGFDAPDHPDLIALFLEYEGEPSASFLEHGNFDARRALAAITTSEKG